MVGMSQREQEILSLVISEGEIAVSVLSDRLGVSAVTIRSDLRSLEAKGMIIRSHGSAMAAYNPYFLEKQNSNTEYKNRIAQIAASMVHDGEKIMVTNGTTSALIAKYLYGKRDIQIVTNSTLLLPYMRTNPNVSLTVVGGEFRPSAEALVGPIALSQLEHYHVGITFAGTDGFSITHGFTTHLTENAEIVRRMCAQGTRRIIVADSSKFDQVGFVRIFNLNEVDAIITDARLIPEARHRIEDMNIELLIAD
ncbi:MAG: DeoR/GlpR transcriptional regulator [Sphaerochaetaceae bacterium]|nr:DeoR/GlpR transcriptional regulator [Sphaerochaetaceae bacterium]